MRQIRRRKKKQVVNRTQNKLLTCCFVSAIFNTVTGSFELRPLLTDIIVCQDETLNKNRKGNSTQTFSAAAAAAIIVCPYPCVASYYQQHFGGKRSELLAASNIVILILIINRPLQAMVIIIIIPEILQEAI